MRILFLTPYFPPEVGAPQTRIYEMALRLKNMGHEVSILTTFPNYPTGIVHPEWRGMLFSDKEEGGLRVLRVWSYATPNSGFYKRILGQLSFPFAAMLSAFKLPKAEAIIVESPPLFNGFAGIFLSWIKRAPYVFNVADLWPETAVQLGVLKNKNLIAFAKWAELLFYRRSARVLAVTAGIRDAIVADGIPQQKVELFRSGVDTDFYAPQPRSEKMRAKLGVQPSEFLLLYAGTLGLAQQLDAVLDAAAILQQNGNRNVRLVFAGDGAEGTALRDKAKQLSLQNVHFAGVFKKTEMPELLSAADAILVSLRDLDIMRAALPTKMLEAMACGKPLVLAAKGEAEDLLLAAGSGSCALPGNPQSIHDAIAGLASNPESTSQMGSRGRAFMLAHFSRAQRAKRLSEILTEVSAERKAAVRNAQVASLEKV